MVYVTVGEERHTWRSPVGAHQHSQPTWMCVRACGERERERAPESLIPVVDPGRRRRRSILYPRPGQQPPPPFSMVYRDVFACKYFPKGDGRGGGHQFWDLADAHASCYCVSGRPDKQRNHGSIPRWSSRPGFRLCFLRRVWV